MQPAGLSPWPGRSRRDATLVAVTRVPPTADICDAYPESVQVADQPFRDYGGVRTFSGQVETVRCFEDNSLVRRALEQPGEGRVLVVDGGTSMRVALLGDRLGAIAIQNGWAGVVIEGCVRDVAALRELPIGIRALGSNPRPSIKRSQGQLGVMVRLGRMDVRAGWWLYADADGTIALPHAAELDA